MIRVGVRLYATLRRYGPHLPVGTPWIAEVEDGATLEDLIGRLGLPAGELKLAFVNGRGQEVSSRLRAGDEVGLFPPIAGASGCLGGPGLKAVPLRS